MDQPQGDLEKQLLVPQEKEEEETVKEGCCQEIRHILFFTWSMVVHLLVKGLPVFAVLYLLNIGLQASLL